VSQYRQVQDIRMDSPVLEHKFKYQARLHMERTARLRKELRSTHAGGGARKEALDRADKPLPRSKLDCSKSQVQLLCQQAMSRAG
jgi:hypothetical protein